MADQLLEEMANTASALHRQGADYKEAIRTAALRHKPHLSGDADSLQFYVREIGRTLAMRGAEKRRQRFNQLVDRVADLLPELRNKLHPKSQADRMRIYCQAVNEAAEEVGFHLPRRRQSLDALFSKVGTALRERVSSHTPAA